MSSLSDWMAGALTAEGAVVEPVDSENLNVLLPQDLRNIFHANEFIRLGFGQNLPDGVKRLTLESDWVDVLGSRLQARSRFLESHLAPGPCKLPDPEEVLAKALAFNNATYRFTKMEPGLARYRIIPLMISAVSDEKRDDIAIIGLNESNMARNDPFAVTYIEQLRTGHGSSAAIPPEWAPAWTAEQMCKAVTQNARMAARARLNPFLASMERRLARDLDRLHSYHEELCHEASRKRTDGKGRQANAQDAAKVESMRLAAIKREYESKVADVRLKYNVSVEISILQALVVTLPIYRLGFVIRRRKGERPYHLDWNPLSRKLDTPICEACGITPDTAAICDDRLHYVCAACLSACPTCGKSYCRACHTSGCPVAKSGRKHQPLDPKTRFHGDDCEAP